MPGFKKAVTDTMDWRALHETAFTSQAQCESQHSRACSDWCARSIHSVTTFLCACRFHWPRLFTCRRHSSVNTAPSSTPPLHLSATPTRPHAPQKCKHPTSLLALLSRRIHADLSRSNKVRADPRSVGESPAASHQASHDGRPQGQAPRQPTSRC